MRRERKGEGRRKRMLRTQSRRLVVWGGSNTSVQINAFSRVTPYCWLSELKKVECVGPGFLAGCSSLNI